MDVTNGYVNKYGYLQQYFDKAYRIGNNGTITTNETGLLSPYGEFFPTEPGPTALITLPDLDSGQRGTSIVHAFKLQLDVNHDGMMDLTFGGPDNTSIERPFVFWVNNDYDRKGKQFGDPDDDVQVAASPYTNAHTPDCEYRNVYGERNIPSVRDTEDFARLWLDPGMSTNFFCIAPHERYCRTELGRQGQSQHQQSHN
jgi:hypothetical protein